MQIEGNAPGFFQGVPTGASFDVIDTFEPPDEERLDIPKQHVVRIFSAGDGWEITYQGKKKLSQQKIDDSLRLKNHSLAVGPG